MHTACHVHMICVCVCCIVLYVTYSKMHQHINTSYEHDKGSQRNYIDVRVRARARPALRPIAMFRMYCNAHIVRTPPCLGLARRRARSNAVALLRHVASSGCHGQSPYYYSGFQRV